MNKHTHCLLTASSVSDNMNYIQAYHENKFNTNQMHDTSSVRGMYDRMLLKRQHRYQGQPLIQQTCCFGDVSPVERNKNDVDFDLGSENWLQK